MTDAGKNQAFDYGVVSILTIAAVLTRATGLGEWDFLVDEFATYYYADERMLRLQNPAYYALVHWSFQLLGQSEFSARLPAMVLGAAAIPTFYWVLRHPLGRYAALIGSMLLLLSSWHLWYSQFSRFYSGVFFFGLLSFYFFWRAITKDDLRLIWLTLLANGLGILFHLTSVMVPAACGLFLVLTLTFKGLRPDSYSLRIAKVFLGIYMACGLLLLPLLPKFLGSWESKGQSWGFGPAGFVLQLVKYVQLPIAVSAFLGCLSMLKECRGSAAYILIGTVFPAVTLAVLSAVTSVRPDYFFYSLPLVFVAAAYLCGIVFDFERVKPLVALALPAVLFASLLPEFVSHYTGHRSLDVRETISFIQPRLEPGDEVLPMVSGFSHYAKDSIPLAFRPGSPFDSSVNWGETLSESSSNAVRLWIVVPAGRQRYASQFEKWLGENAHLVWRKYEKRFDYTYRGLEIYRTNEKL
jgi:hypothetical protein